MQEQMSSEVIENFLEGRDPQKYIVGIEASYHENFVSLIVNDPETGKRVEKHKFKPFIWVKEEALRLLYDGNRSKRLEMQNEFKIRVKRLVIKNRKGEIPTRLDNGYKYLVETTGGYNNILQFFRMGGVNPFPTEKQKAAGKNYRDLFMNVSPAEQFMIYSGKRLFKGFDDYDDLHRFQFDLETTGLDPRKDSIFQIGIKDNRGIEHVIEVKGKTDEERRASERDAIQRFFFYVRKMEPDVIAGYNSENFDFDFFFVRCERLGIDITEIALTMNTLHSIKRKDSTLKLGGETEYYKSTQMWGFNIIDIAHAVRRAMAINSDIKGWGLKYITKFSDIAKENRVYVPGDQIHSTWADESNDYALNEENGDWYKVSETRPDIDEGYTKVTGAYVVKRYLIDDLWETEQIDKMYNQASFLLAKLVPSSYQRSSTMGTATLWKLLMLAWSYENGLGIPELQPKRAFTGGLSRLLEVGFAWDVVKLDYAALYPNEILTYDIYTDVDITGVMGGMLRYIADTRDLYKNMKNDFAEKGDHKQADFYDKKQLPLKILANSFFGSFGAPYLFPWGDVDCAEETTCRGRQHLRLMVKHFTEKHGFRPLVGDTDGFNFAIPKTVNEIKYIGTGKHRFTEKDKEYTGVDAVVAEFNDVYMEGRMGLDIDDICKSTINFARKNYANAIVKKNKDGSTKIKQKLVGNTIKSNKLQTFIAEFLDKSIHMLLDGDGYSFLELYYEYVEKIYNCNIPLTKIASKSKVKMDIKSYKARAKKKNKAGNPLPKQAHMELILNHDMNPDLGDIVYYVNTGTRKSHGDLKTITDKETKKKTVELNCVMIENEVIERDSDTLKQIAILKSEAEKLGDNNESRLDEIETEIDELEDTLTKLDYNVARYMAAFNKRIKPLLVCFSPEIRDQILIENPDKRPVFQKSQCELDSGNPYSDTDQDSYKALMTMEDKEIKFWTSVNKTPNDIDINEWKTVVDDYNHRMAVQREAEIAEEKASVPELMKRIEIWDFELFFENGSIPMLLDAIAVVNDNNELISRKFGVVIGQFEDILKYEVDAKSRYQFYGTLDKGLTNTEMYDHWVNHLIAEEHKNYKGYQELGY